MWGCIPGISGTPTWEEDFTFDATGNWTNYLTKVSGSTTLNQNRTQNVANEISTIAASSTYVGYDSAGNMTRCPRTSSWTTAYDLTYDAWNRLIRIKQGAATVGTYTYDGLNRRVSKVAGGVTRHYYYSDQWQILEERTGTSSCAERQFVWGLRYIDDLIVRDRATSSSSSSSSCPAMNERLYVLHDYFSVTAVTNSSGTVLERYGYDAFGESRVMTSSFGSRATSSYDWDVRYGAYRWDSESDFYQVRYRYLHPALGRWLSRDPLGELGGMNLYAYVDNNPISVVDPHGLAPWIVKLGAKTCKKLPWCKKHLKKMVDKLKSKCSNIKCQLKLHVAHHPFPVKGGGTKKKCHFEILCFIEGKKVAQ